MDRGAQWATVHRIIKSQPQVTNTFISLAVMEELNDESPCVWLYIDP